MRYGQRARRNHLRHRRSARRRAIARREGRTERHALPVTARGSAITPSGCPSRSARRQPNIKDCPLALSSADPCDRGTPCASECFERSDSQGRMDQDAGTLAGSGHQKVKTHRHRADGGRVGHQPSVGRPRSALGGAWPVTGRPRRCLAGPPPPSAVRGRSPVAHGGPGRSRLPSAVCGRSPIHLGCGLGFEKARAIPSHS